MKGIRLIAIVLLFSLLGKAQSRSASYTFIDYQRSFPRINDALKRIEDTLISQFRQRNLEWPAKYIYLRSFKYDSQLEVWIKYQKEEKFQLFKTYKVCALSGSLGPKRMQGDYQVPEGFYYINQFNPNSNYHLSLGLNYPNLSDRILADSLQPGGDIYIHGSCVTTGCIPITNNQIEELYVLASHARSEGQDFIPVHIFPVKFDHTRSADYLKRFLLDYPEYIPFNAKLKQAYYYFQRSRQLPLIMVDPNGDYILDENASADVPFEDAVAMRKDDEGDDCDEEVCEEELARVMDVQPEFPGGLTQYQQFLEGLTREVADYLYVDQDKANIMVEFIINKNGRPTKARVIRGGNEYLNQLVETRFNQMPSWTPAVRLDQRVPVRLKQSLFIERVKP